MRPRCSVVVAGCAAACGVPGPLVDTPIVGGSDEARAAVLAELAAFDQATGGGRTPVSRVEFADLGGPYGTYRRTSHAVMLEASLPTTTAAFYNVSLVLRHELCHALNQQEDLHLEREALYEDIGGQLDLHGGACSGRRCLLDEAFAQRCHLGPWIAAFVADGCPDDPIAPDVFQHQAEVLWVAADEPRQTAVEDEWAAVDLAEHGATVPLDPLWFYTTPEHPDTLKIVWSNDRHELFVDRRTGDVAPDAFNFHWNLAPPPASLDPLVLRVDGNAWSEEGPFVGVATARDIDEDGDVYRLVWHDGERWALVGDGCRQEGVYPFATDGVFSVRVEGTRISWAPVSGSL